MKTSKFLGTFSKLDFEPDFNMPPTEVAMARLIGHINKKESKQGAAASLATDLLWIAEFAGVLGDAFLQIQTVAGAGESMTVNILKNGTSIMTGGTAITIDATHFATAGKQQNLIASLDPTKLGFAEGDLFQVTRVYTAGGTPAPIGANRVVIEPTIRKWK